MRTNKTKSARRAESYRRRKLKFGTHRTESDGESVPELRERQPKDFAYVAPKRELFVHIPPTWPGLSLGTSYDARYSSW